MEPAVTSDELRCEEVEVLSDRFYGASKAALVSLIRTIARENADVHVSANVVLPGTMDTPANRAADPNADYPKWVHPCHWRNSVR